MSFETRNFFLFSNIIRGFAPDAVPTVLIAIRVGIVLLAFLLLLLLLLGSKGLVHPKCCTAR